MTLKVTEYDLFYLLNEKNYIMFQGITVCIKMLEHVVVNDQDALTRAEGYQLTFETKQDPVYDNKTGQTYEYDNDAMNGIGGYCFGIHLETSENSYVSS